MNRVRLGGVLLGCALLAVPVSAVDITIDCGKRYQQMEGIGAMLYPYGGFTYYNSAQFLDDYVGDQGNSMMRFEIMPGFCKTALSAAQMADYRNYSRDDLADYFTGLRNVKTRDSTIKIIGTVWAPPGWMKSNGQSCCGGSLLPANYNLFARYLYQYYRFLQDSVGVTLYAISTQNELSFYEPYNSCVYNTQQYHDMMLAVGAYFDSVGCAVKFFGPEEMTGFTNNVVNFVSAIKDDAAATGSLDIIATHGYSNGVISDGGTPAQNMEVYTRLKQYGLPFWMTETSGEDWHWDDGKGYNDDGSPMQGALSGLGKKMHVAFTYGFCSGWTYWAYAANPADLGAYGFGPSIRDGKYLVHKHYSKFIRPGAWRVSASPDGQQAISVSAYHHSTQNTLTAVLLNTGDTARTVNLTVGQGVIVGQFTEYLSTSQGRFVDQGTVTVSPTTNTAAFSMPPRSMVTLTGSATTGTQGSPPPAPTIALNAPATSSTTTIPATLTINRGFGYYSTDSTNWTSFDLVYNLGSVIVPIAASATLYFYASDGVVSSAVQKQAFTITHPGAAAYQQDGNGLVQIEAENYNTTGPGTGAYTRYNWALAGGPLFASVMEVLPNDDSVRGSTNVGTAGAIISYRVNFNRTGAHSIWVRGTGVASYGSDGWYNSTVSYGIDGAASGWLGPFRTEMSRSGLGVDSLLYGYMQWKQGTINVATTGEHVISFWMRADGFKLDKFDIASSTTYTPASYVAAPASPTGITVTDSSLTRLSLRWNRTARAYGYRLYYHNVTAGQGWNGDSWYLYDSSTTSARFDRLSYRGDPRDSLHASTAYEFHVVALGPQADSHGSNPPGTVPLARGTTAAGGNGGTLCFTASSMSGYPIPQPPLDTFLTGGYYWRLANCSSDLSVVGTTDSIFDKACWTYDTNSWVGSLDSIPGGLGTISLRTSGMGCCGVGGGNVGISVNGAGVAQTHVVESWMADTQTYYFPGVNVTGPVLINIRNLQAPNGNGSRAIFGDFRWTGYAGGAPGRPTGLSATGYAQGVRLSWQTVSGATSYRVYRKGKYDGQYVLRTSSAGSDTSAVDMAVSLVWPGVYRVTAVNAGGESAWSDSVTALLYHCGPTEPGLWAVYFNERDFAGTSMQQLDTAVNFNWSGAPAPGITADGSYSAVWVGDVTPQYSETYTFYTRSDDGARLWVNGVKLVDDWAGHGATERSGTISLQAGVKYHILMQYYNNGGGAVAELRWSSTSQAKQIIPSARLSTGPSCVPLSIMPRTAGASRGIAAPYVRPAAGRILFGVPAGQWWRLSVYDMAGRLVVRRTGAGGTPEALSTRLLGSGTYVVRLTTPSTVLTRRVLAAR